LPAAITDSFYDCEQTFALPSLAASESWRAYGRAGGARERVISDFLIGAHAQMRADRLLTRDRGFYRSYLRELTVLDPSTP
jgi:predicted nucleic acid-binding protein